MTAAATRPKADILAQELRRTLIANRYSPAAAVRVILDAELAHEMRLERATAIASGVGESPPAVNTSTVLAVDYAD